ncbi:hypothetical protein [Mucilaginibacter sp. L196]|uniref:hypothetical protein n=1 Tax=Mucilaginibacter sp. L196 TaxID=1641870 RepID=UPI00131C03AE|nr:hypothetical protein [Mucilaginibacter sp. L196]
MWKKLSYELKTPTGNRQLQIYSNFQKDDDEYLVDKGKYTVKENSIKLGDLHIDLYIGDGITWEGKPNEFTTDQLTEIANYIKGHDSGDELE